jgi:hypothetical protein
VSESVTRAPGGSVRVPRRFTLQRPPLKAEIGTLLRQRLLLVAVVIAGTTIFFATYRALTPLQWQFYTSSWPGVSLLLFEAGLKLGMRTSLNSIAPLPAARPLGDGLTRTQKPGGP